MHLPQLIAETVRHKYLYQIILLIPLVWLREVAELLEESFEQLSELQQKIRNSWQQESALLVWELLAVLRVQKYTHRQMARYLRVLVRKSL